MSVTPQPPAQPSKLTVRERAPQLTAVRLPTAREVTLYDGRTVQAGVGAWMITRGKIILDVATPQALNQRYEVIDDQGLTLRGYDRDRLEQTTGVGSTRTPTDLVEAVERLAAISIGTIHVDFTPGQLAEIKHRAAKRGHTVEQELRATVDRIKEAIFWGN